jgi:hypothetical protein
MTVLTRGQIRPGVVGIDTTVKSASGLWRSFAPTWPMVMGVKRGASTWEQYAAKYRAILTRVPDVVWNTLAAQPDARLLCYCRDGLACRTHLIIEYAVGIWLDRFRDGCT